MLVEYNPILVALSIAVAIMGSFTGLLLTSGTLRAAPGSLKLRILKGAIAIGGSIWSMHFIGMLAVKLPVRVEYDVLLTLVSALTAMLVTGLGLYACSYRPRSRLRLLLGGVLMGAGIATMHYIGMSAIRGGCSVSHSAPGVLLAIAVAVGASSAAMWFAFRRSDMIVLTVGAVVLGLTISAMHYIAMLATTFLPVEALVELSGPVLNTDNLAIVLALASFVICGLFLLMALPDGQSPARPLLPAHGREPGEGEDTAVAGLGVRRIPVRRNNTTLYLHPDAIVSVNAQGHYSLVATRNGEFFCDLSISKLEKLLAESDIIRSHRSFLVNLKHVQGLSRDGDRGVLILDEAQEKTIPVSRAKLETIRQYLEFAPGGSEPSFG